MIQFQYAFAKERLKGGDLKMKRVLALAMIFTIGFCALQATAEAKLVTGKVESVDVTGKTISINAADPATGTESKATVSVDDAATYTGVTSLDQIKAGDDIWVEAEEDVATGGWKTNSVNVTPAAPVAPEEVSQ